MRAKDGFFFLMIRRPPRSALLPYTALFRSLRGPEEPQAGHARRLRGRDSARAGLQREGDPGEVPRRSEEHTSELQSRQYLVCRLLLEKKNAAFLVVSSPLGPLVAFPTTASI